MGGGGAHLLVQGGRYICCDTVDGRNPHHLGCKTPIKKWDKLPSSTGLAGFLPSKILLLTQNHRIELQQLELPIYQFPRFGRSPKWIMLNHCCLSGGLLSVCFGGKKYRILGLKMMIMYVFFVFKGNLHRKPLYLVFSRVKNVCPKIKKWHARKAWSVFCSLDPLYGIL